MQFDIDSSGEFADIFLMIRGILLTFPEIREQKNAKQTAYYDAYSAVCFLRSDKEKLTLALAKGAALLPKFPFLKGEGKIVRHLYFKKSNKVDREQIVSIIRETLMLNLEASELKKLRKSLL